MLPKIRSIAIGVACLALRLGLGQIRGFPPIAPQRAYGHAVEGASIDVRFSLHGGCTDAVVQALGGAKKTVLVQAYSFTSAEIAGALVAAHRRGVKVQMILDKSQRTERYSSADFVAHAGIPTFIDARHAIAHNEVMVIDGETVLTGSCNFTTPPRSTTLRTCS